MVLIFHGIGEPPPHIKTDERPYWISNSLFCDVLSLVRDYRFACDVVLTFDDGNGSDMFAAEELTKAGLKGIFFPVAGRLGLPEYLNDSGVRAISEAGMEVGLHGRSHVDWRRLRAPDWAVEVDDARARIADASGAPVRSVAIPFGSYDRTVLRRLKNYDFERTYSSDAGPVRGTSRVLPRTSLTCCDSIPSVIRLIQNECGVLGRARQMLAPLVKSWR